MRHADLALFENLYLAVVDIHDVRGQQPPGEQSQIFEVERRARVVFFGYGLRLGRGLGEVSEDRDVALLGEGFDLFEMPRADGIGRVRRDGWRDQRVAFPTFDEAVGVTERGLPRLVVRRRKIDDRFAERSAKPRL